MHQNRAPLQTLPVPMCDAFCCIPIFVTRHCPCIPSRDRDRTDVLFFGDSSMDYMKYSSTSWFCCDEREEWRTLRKKLSTLRIRNMSMSGAPAYELCCLSTLFLSCRPCRPKRAIVTSMGGNDFLWLPLPTCHETLSSACGVDCPLLYTQCFLNQTTRTFCSYRVEIFSDGSNNKDALKVIWICDHVVQTMLWTKSYDKYLRSVRDLAGVVIEIKASESAIRDFLDNKGTPRLDDMFTYTSRTNTRAAYPNLIFLDSISLLRNLEAKLPTSAYAKLWTGCESSKKQVRMWVEWVEYAIRTQKI